MQSEYKGYTDNPPPPRQNPLMRLNLLRFTMKNVVIDDYWSRVHDVFHAHYAAQFIPRLLIAQYTPPSADVDATSRRRRCEIRN